MTDRSEASRALAKVIAYQNVGNEAQAGDWLVTLLNTLGYPTTYAVLSQTATVTIDLAKAK